MWCGRNAGSAVQEVLGYTSDEARLLHMFLAPYSSSLVFEFALSKRKKHFRHESEKILQTIPIAFQFLLCLRADQAQCLQSVLKFVLSLESL